MQLTQQQQAIIAHEQGHAKVVAVAGAGKTSTLALFIRQRLLQGTSPKRMLVIMYNKSAQQDFSQKLQHTLQDIHQPAPQVRTFHALGLRIYQTLISQGHLPAFQGEPLRQIEQELQLWRMMQQFAGKTLAQEILQDKKKWLDPMMSFMEQVKSCLEPPKVVFKRSGLPAQCSFFVKVFDAFEQWRKDNRRITYSDMLYDPCMLFSQRSDLMMHFANHMDWILVDEYQDINPIQQFLLQVLAGERANVMVIGDPDQTIYEFRGSSAHFMLRDFDQQFAGAKRFQLSHSFRYGHDVALLANQLIQFNKEREPVLSIAHAGNPDTQINYIEYEDESQSLINVIKHALQNYPPEQICILYRLWGMSAPLELSLLENNIPYNLPHHSWVLERSELQTFMMLLEMAAGVFYERTERSRYQAWLLFFTQPVIKIKRAVIDEMARALAKAGDKANQAFSQMMFSDLSRWQKQQLEERMNYVRMASDKRLKAHQLLNRYIRETDFYSSLSDSAFSAQQVDDKVATVQGFLRFMNKLNIAASDAHEYLQNLKAIKQSQKNQAGVLISSIHRAKGLQWPVVIMPSLTDRYYPYESDGEMHQATSIESERRLFYVAMTRAMHQLHLLTPSANQQENSKHNISPFLQTMQVKDLLTIKPAGLSGQADIGISLPKQMIPMAQQYCQAVDWPLTIAAKAPQKPVMSAIDGQKKTKREKQLPKVQGRYATKEIQEKIRLEHSRFGHGQLVNESERHWHVEFDDGQKRVLDKEVAGPMMSWLT